MTAEPSLVFTAAQGWHLAGGEVEKAMQKRTEALERARIHRELVERAESDARQAQRELERLAGLVHQPAARHGIWASLPEVA